MTIVTKQDLEQFRIQLLEDIRQILISHDVQPIKPWLKKCRSKEAT